MVADLAITAGGVLPFYLGLFAIFTRQFQTRYLRLMSIFFLAGLTTVPFFLLRHYGFDAATLSNLFGPLFSLILLAFAEEIAKSIALFFDKELKRHYYYPIVIGLGFAFFENISYLLGFNFSMNFLVIAFIRMFMGSTIHATLTTVVAHMMNKSTRKTRIMYYLLGLLIAGSFHSLYNLFHLWEMSYMTVPLLVLLIVYLHFDHAVEPSHRHTSLPQQKSAGQLRLARTDRAS